MATNFNDPILPESGMYSKQNFSCIYMIKSICKGVCYVGSAKHFGIRRRNHIHALKNNTHHSIILQNHYNKYGVGDLIFYILEKIEWSDDAYNIEQSYIDKYQPYFNVIKKVVGCSNKKMSDETKQKIRLAITGKKQSEYTKEKRNKALKDAFLNMDECKKENRKKGGYAKRKKVICNETKHIYLSIADAETSTGCDNIWAICNGLRKQSKGFTFSYAK